MKILCLDTSTARLNISVANGDTILFEDTSLPRIGSHAQYLPQSVNVALHEAGFESIHELDAIGVVTGPGSFTGLRIGISIAKGLAFASGLSLIALDALDVLAMGAPFSAEFVCAAIDAKKSQVYASIYQVKENKITRISEPVSTVPLTVPFPEKGEIMCVGDGVPLYEMAFQEVLKDRFIPAPLDYHVISPRIMAQVAFRAYQEGRLEKPETLCAMYVRRSDAEIQRDLRHATR